VVEILLKGIVFIVKLPLNIIAFPFLLVAKLVFSPRIKLWF